MDRRISRKAGRLTVSILLTGMLILPQAWAADSQLLNAANNMIQTGKPLDAFDLLSPFEFEYAGEKEFDYLLGLSLLDSGEPGKSVFAFQRVLAQDPDFAGARLELARAYFDMSEYSLSRAEFSRLNTQSPPADVQDVINKYLTTIRNRTLRNKQGWSGYVQLGIGTDSNANNAPDVDSFLGFDLSEQSRETSSSVISTIGGVSYDLPVNYRRSYFVRSNINHRANNDASFTSTFSFDIAGGVNQNFKNGDSLRFSVQVYDSDVDGESNSSGFNVNTQYRFNFSSVNQLGFFLRLGEIDYVETFDVRDVDQTVFGTSWVHIFNSSLRPSLVSTLILGQDDAQLSSSPYGRDYTGLRFTSAVALTHELNLYGTIGATSSVFDSEFFGISGDREDDTTDFGVGASWRFNKTWTLKAQLNQVDNSSNIDIYNYEKSEIMIIARSDFLP